MPFNFYNVTYYFAIVSTNGNIQFATSNTASSGTVTALSPVIDFYFAYMYAYPSYYCQTSGTAGALKFTLRIPVNGAYLEVSPYGYTGGIDVVLFQADGHIEIRYYNFPIASAAITVGISGSSSDYIYLINSAVPTLSQAVVLTGAVVSFTPVSYTQPPPVSASISFTNTSTSSYVPHYNSSVVPLVALSAATNVFTSSQVYSYGFAAIGFPFTFYNATYNLVQVSNYGYMAFGNIATATTPVIPTSFSTATAISFVGLPLYGNWQYQTIGSSGAYQFVLRTTNAEIYYTPYTQLLSIDIVLFQADGHIEIRYYAMSYPWRLSHTDDRRQRIGNRLRLSHQRRRAVTSARIRVTRRNDLIHSDTLHARRSLHRTVNHGVIIVFHVHCFHRLLESIIHAAGITSVGTGGGDAGFQHPRAHRHRIPLHFLWSRLPLSGGQLQRIYAVRR